MAQFKTDLKDIYFNLFNVLKIQGHNGVVENDMKDIINECNKFIEKEAIFQYTCNFQTDFTLNETISGGEYICNCYGTVFNGLPNISFSYLVSRVDF